MEDLCLGQNVAEGLAGGLVVLHNLHPDAQPEQLAGQVKGDPPAAHDQDGADAVPVQPGAFKEGIQVGMACGNADMVPRFQHEIAGGDDDFLVPLHRAHQHLGAKLGLQVLQRHPIQRGFLGQCDLRHFQPSLGKQLQFGGAGEAEHPAYGIRRLHFRVDSHGKSQLLPQKQHLLEIVRVAHPGNDVLGAVFPGHDAAQNVEFIR